MECVFGRTTVNKLTTPREKERHAAIAQRRGARLPLLYGYHGSSSCPGYSRLYP